MHNIIKILVFVTAVLFLTDMERVKSQGVHVCCATKYT